MKNERIKRCLERHPDWTDRRVANATGTRQSQVAALRTGEPKERQSGVTGGISLSGVRVSNRKPNDSVRRLLYQLRKGMAYPVAALSETWNVGVDTIRQHAKRVNALKYVEVSPGEWVACAMHPDTAEELEM